MNKKQIKEALDDSNQLRMFEDFKTNNEKNNSDRWSDDRFNHSNQDDKKNAYQA